MTPSARRRQKIGRLIVVAGSASVVVGGVWLVLWGQKTAERMAYHAVTDGASCAPVAAPPAYVETAKLKTGEFQGARFAYLRGDMDCQTMPMGDLADDYAPVCTFDRPGYLSASAGAGRRDYLLVIGQAVLTQAPGGTWRCAVRPPP